MERHPGNWRHLCVDMQRLFAEDTPWKVDWMERISPAIIEVASRHPERTVFTRFMPPRQPGEMQGQWRPYYKKWWMMTGEHLPDEMTGLIAPLARLVPPAMQFDKRTYSPWLDGRLNRLFREAGVQTLVVSGGETDVCVLATIMGAIDLGYRVILLSDAVCSGADETHDMTLKLLASRFSVQLELAETGRFLSAATSGQ